MAIATSIQWILASSLHPLLRGFLLPHISEVHQGGPQDRLVDQQWGMWMRESLRESRTYIFELSREPDELNNNLLHFWRELPYGRTHALKFGVWSWRRSMQAPISAS